MTTANNSAANNSDFVFDDYINKIEILIDTISRQFNYLLSHSEELPNSSNILEEQIMDINKIKSKFESCMNKLNSLILKHTLEQEPRVFNFGESSTQPSRFGSTSSFPQQFSFGSTSSFTQPSRFGSTTQPFSFGSSAQPSRFGSTTQPFSFGSTTTTFENGSFSHPYAFGSNTFGTCFERHSSGFGTTFQTPSSVFGSTTSTSVQTQPSGLNSEVRVNGVKSEEPSSSCSKSFSSGTSENLKQNTDTPQHPKKKMKLYTISDDIELSENTASTSKAGSSDKRQSKITKKRLRTNKKRFGTEHPMQNKTIIDKAVNTKKISKLRKSVKNNTITFSECDAFIEHFISQSPDEIERCLYNLRTFNLLQKHMFITEIIETLESQLKMLH